jgi:hypothetical protein
VDGAEMQRQVVLWVVRPRWVLRRRGWQMELRFYGRRMRTGRISIACMHEEIKSSALSTQHHIFNTASHYLYPSLSIHPSIHPSIQLSINLSIYPSIRLSFLSSHQQFLHIAYLGIYPSIHPSIYPSIYSYHWSSNLDLLYYPMSGTEKSSGWIYHLVVSIIRVLLNITGKSYFFFLRAFWASSRSWN